ncbi:MAG: RHH-type proline utilization regulon transcriptional repressor/proline dehydrogenase, partial [Lentimonas sp.]
MSKSTVVTTTSFNAAALQGLSDTALSQQAIELAKVILENAIRQQSLAERYQAWKMSRMMEDPAGKALTLALSDQVFRPVSHRRSADQFRHLIDQYGVPAYLPLHERVGMKLGAIASRFAPSIVMPAVSQKLRSESAAVILPSEDAKLKPHLAKRKREKTRMNINQLGEAILGEHEAENRIQQVLDRLSSPDCEYISVKISAIFSQINLVAYEQTLEQIKARIRRLYRCAIEHTCTNDAGAVGPKFVNLDMEEYRDLRLTCDAFKQVLEEEAFAQLPAGIVLQAYLPDSHPVQIELTEWATQRTASGKAGIKIRIVKGANLAMETVDASIHHWPMAPYGTKREVDANYKRMVHYGCRMENARSVRLGIASHNLFEVAYSLLLRTREGVEEFVEIEMLEGMANHQARAVQEFAGGMLRYAPVVKKEDFHSAISYLVRRLDENTHEENFLHDIFGMQPGCPKWTKQKALFLAACEIKDSVQHTPNRVQDRANQTFTADDRKAFHNSPDTDWSLRRTAQWITAKIEAMRESEHPTVPLQIGGETRTTRTLGQ